MMAASFKYRLIVGLGNPGKEYKNTYHNIGLLFVDYLAHDAKFEADRNFKYAKTNETVFVKPLTFMNESGVAVAQAMKYFSAKGGSAAGGKIKAQEVLITHDDADIELGKYKIVSGRGSAGHKGVESIIKTLHTKEFSRLRIGVRTRTRAKAGDFVLKKISRTHLGVLNEVFKEIKEKESLNF